MTLITNVAVAPKGPKEPGPLTEVGTGQTDANVNANFTNEEQPGGSSASAITGGF